MGYRSWVSRKGTTTAFGRCVSPPVVPYGVPLLTVTYARTTFVGPTRSSGFMQGTVPLVSFSSVVGRSPLEEGDVTLPRSSS